MTSCSLGSPSRTTPAARFGAPIRLDAVSALGRVDVALLPDGSALATWIEFADQRSSFATRRIEASGRKSPITAVSAIAGPRASGYPRTAVDRGEVVFAWTEASGGQAIVKTAAAKVAVTGASSR